MTQNWYILLLNIVNGMVIFSWMRLAFEVVDLVKHFSIPMWVGIIQFLEGLNGTESWRKEELIFSCLTAWARTSIFPACGAPGSQAFRLGLNYTTGFPGSPVCKQQIVGLLGLHNYVIWFLVINLFMYISSCFYFSRELWLVQDIRMQTTTM